MGKMLKIMLAQDTDTQTGCAAALRSSGFEVETVRKDGAQILRLFRQGSRPDVLIMDAFMQGTDASACSEGSRICALSRARWCSSPRQTRIRASSRR